MFFEVWANKSISVRIRRWAKGPSIKDVFAIIHGFLKPPSPMLTFFYCYPVTNFDQFWLLPPSPLQTSFMDGPTQHQYLRLIKLTACWDQILPRSNRSRKKNLLNLLKPIPFNIPEEKKKSQQDYMKKINQNPDILRPWLITFK